MCNLSKGVMEKRLAKGRTEGITNAIKNLMESFGLSVEQAITALKIPEVERQKYMDLLKQQQSQNAAAQKLS